MQNSKTVVTKTTQIAPGHTLVETITKVQKVELWPWEPIETTDSGSHRLGEPEALEGCLAKYDSRQLAACCAFLGADDTPQIGPYCEEEAAVSAFSIKNRQARGLVLEGQNKEGGFAILVLFTANRLPTFSNEVFFETQWTNEDDRGTCLSFLKKSGVDLLINEIFVVSNAGGVE